MWGTVLYERVIALVLRRGKRSASDRILQMDRGFRWNVVSNAKLSSALNTLTSGPLGQKFVSGARALC